jgi:alkylhydroperoxidase/carboxymuconolactone decarboxylase family protein YurZ
MSHTDAEHPHMFRVLSNDRISDWDSVVAMDPDYFDAAERLFGYPHERRKLPVKEQALLEMALDALVTQLDERRLPSAIGRAIDAGATRDEILCVLEIVVVIGLHSCTVAIPVLCEELYGDDGPPPLTPAQVKVARRFETSELRPRPLDAMFGSILRMDLDYFERFVTFVDVPWRPGVLDERFKHLVCIAIDVACTHLYVDGIRRHVRAALELGVTPEEILEVIQLASSTGLRTLRSALPVIAPLFAEPMPPDVTAAGPVAVQTLLEGGRAAPG